MEDSDNFDAIFTDIVYKCLKDRDLEKLQRSFKSLSNEQRSHIVNYKNDDEVTPIFSACLEGKEDFVQYMVKDCNADIEQRCRYILESEKFNDLVTPLWVSVSEKHLNIVKLLVEHGANINSTSSTNSTPVRCACFNGDFETVKYLVEHGADIHLPNIWGGTCLINSNRGTASLVEYLISKGACVNRTDTSGSNALHFAIREGRLDLVKVFLYHNVDYNKKNDRGDSATQTAALYGQKEILDYLINNTIISKIDVINSYDLYGSTLIEDFNDLDGALHIWKKTFLLRQSNPKRIISKCLPEKPNKAFLYVKEANTLSEYEALSSSTPDPLYMHSLLIRERILGPAHKETIYGLRYRGAVYADTGLYQRCIDLWKHAYIAQRQFSRANDSDVITCVTHFTEVMVEFQSKSNGASQNKIKKEDVLELLDLMIGQASDFMSALLVRPLAKHTFKDFRLLLVLILHVINVAIKLEENGSPDETLNTHVRRFLSLNARSEEKESPLHLALKAENSSLENRFCNRFPSTKLVGRLLSCHANPNVVDAEKATPLHYCLAYMGSDDVDTEQGCEIINLLLNKGAHVDMRSTKNISPLNQLGSYGVLICPVKSRSLQCLAAEVIMKHNIDFKHNVPVSIVPFIEMH